MSTGGPPPPEVTEAWTSTSSTITCHRVVLSLTFLLFTLLFTIIASTIMTRPQWRPIAKLKAHATTEPIQAELFVLTYLPPAQQKGQKFQPLQITYRNPIIHNLPDTPIQLFQRFVPSRVMGKGDKRGSAKLYWRKYKSSIAKASMARYIGCRDLRIPCRSNLDGKPSRKCDQNLLENSG